MSEHIKQHIKQAKQVIYCTNAAKIDLECSTVYWSLFINKALCYCFPYVTFNKISKAINYI